MNPPSSRVCWRKSSRSGGTNGNCIELANTLHAVRDSKNPAGPVLSANLAGMVAAIQGGHLER